MSAPGDIKVMLVDDQALVREGFAALLQLHEHIAVVGQAADGVSAISMYAQRRPDVVLLDLSLPDIDGLHVLRELVRLDPDARVLILTTFVTDEGQLQAVRDGALGFLGKTSSVDALVAAIHSASVGECSIDRRIVRAASEVHRSEQLTARELEVLRAMATGRSNEQIARMLSMSVNTARTHVCQILRKLDCTNRASAIVLASQRGLLPSTHLPRAF